MIPSLPKTNIFAFLRYIAYFCCHSQGLRGRLQTECARMAGSVHELREVMNIATELWEGGLLENLSYFLLSLKTMSTNDGVVRIAGKCLTQFPGGRNAAKPSNARRNIAPARW